MSWLPYSRWHLDPPDYEEPDMSDPRDDDPWEDDVPDEWWEPRIETLENPPKAAKQLYSKER